MESDVQSPQIQRGFFVYFFFFLILWSVIGCLSLLKKGQEVDLFSSHSHTNLPSAISFAPFDLSL